MGKSCKPVIVLITTERERSNEQAFCIGFIETVFFG